MVLDNPGTAEVSNPCAERPGSELSALQLISAPTASREELKAKMYFNCAAHERLFFGPLFYAFKEET